MTLTLIKHVVNDSSSGSATAASFTLTVTGTAVPGPNASNSRGLPGAELPGTVIPLRPGTYTVTETGPTGYAATSAGSCTNVVVALGDTPTCTITNDDVARPVAFSSTRDGNVEVYRMNADGTSQTRLTTNNALDGEPAWSPDGTKLVFSSTRTGNGDIYRMNADGTGLLRLTTSSGIDLSPAWSPDGTKIAFSSTRDGNVEVYRMNADGSSQTRLTTNNALDGEPAWSPDGTKLVFSSTRTGNGDIYRMNADGTGLLRLTDELGHRPVAGMVAGRHQDRVLAAPATATSRCTG